MIRLKKLSARARYRASNPSIAIPSILDMAATGGIIQAFVGETDKRRLRRQNRNQPKVALPEFVSWQRRIP